MSESQEQKFEDCKRDINTIDKEITKAETTIGVLTRQMDTLKAKRKKLEEDCLREHGVSIKELQSTIDENCQKYINMTEQINTIYNELNKDGESD